jgi:hypothetical protein
MILTFRGSGKPRLCILWWGIKSNLSLRTPRHREITVLPCWLMVKQVPQGVNLLGKLCSAAVESSMRIVRLTIGGPSHCSANHEDLGEMIVEWALKLWFWPNVIVTSENMPVSKRLEALLVLTVSRYWFDITCVYCWPDCPYNQNMSLRSTYYWVNSFGGALSLCCCSSAMVGCG